MQILLHESLSITDNSRFRAPTITLTQRDGVDIEDLGKDEIATVPFFALNGLQAFVAANALSDFGAPKEIISPMVQQLPKSMGVDAPLRHDHAGAEPDQDAA